MNIESGGLVFGAADTVASATLSTPVPTGESFVEGTLRSDHDSGGSVLCSLRLTDEVSGEWTKVTATRLSSADNNTSVRYNVWSDPALTVQEVNIDLSATADASETITAVDLSKAFLVRTFESAGITWSRYPQVTFTDSTTVRAVHNFSESIQVYVYVVEWEGATVQSGNENVDAIASVDVDITAVDLTESILFFNVGWGNMADGNYALRGYFLDSDTLRFVRTNGASRQRWQWYVVSHPDMSVQHIAPAVYADGTTQDETITSAPDATVVGGAWLANAQCETDERRGHVTPYLLNDTTVRFERNVNTASWGVAAFVVEFAGGATGQLLTVESVTHVGAWTDELDSGTAGDIASSIGGETANDATFAQSEVSPSSSPLVFKFTNASAPSSSTDPHTVRVRIAKDAAGGDQIDLTLELREGYTNEGSPGTLIASDTFLNLSDTIAESVLTLTQGEAESITDWTALYGRVVATVPA